MGSLGCLGSSRRRPRMRRAVATSQKERRPSNAQDTIVIATASPRTRTPARSCPSAPCIYLYMTAGGGRPAAARCYGPGPRWLCTRVIPELSTIYQRQPAATLPDHGKERTSHVVYTPHAVGPEMGLKAYTRRIGGER